MDYSRALANLDTADMFANLDTTKTFASLDTTKLFANLDTTKLFANVDVANLFRDAATASKSATVTEEILRSDELARAVAEADIAALADADTGVSTDILRRCSQRLIPSGSSRHAANSQGEWSLLQVIVSAAALIALTSYHQTAEEAAAVSLIAFVLPRWLLSIRSTPWT